MIAESGSNVHQFNHSKIDTVSGRDVIINNEVGARLLTGTESSDLHKIVQRLEDEFQEPGWKTWKFLHRTVGVDSVKEMTLEQLKPVQTVLELMLERAELARQVSRAKANTTQQLTLEGECSRLKSLVLHERSLNENNTREVAQYRQQLDRACQQRDIAIQEQAKLQAWVAQQRDQQESTVQVLRQGRPWKTVIACVMTVLLGGVGVQVYLPVFQAQLLAEENKAAMLKRANICLFDGMPYSWGTRLKTTTGMQKCVKSRTGQYLWQPDK
ncbi:hypothetical protein RA180_06420 [Aeromonas salmonicida]|uniref:hypothetical protein n=1 Tax=Aeromonas salmonicida TaxID=645 RepID=UPI002796A3F6|nr:hypothetical protein [Aeromonas salmonicida]MDQ1883630.1 hypothetical protein [Aeromonas salmonicida]